VTASTSVLALLEPVVRDAGYDLEDVTVSAAGKRSVVRVLVDKDGGITLDDVADVSRRVSEALDVADEQDPTLLGTSYVLEVSSPGVDRPLTAPRHWRRNVGRLVRIALRDGRTAQGRVSAADDDAVTLDGTRVLPYAEVARGSVQVEFNRTTDLDDDLDADAPDDDLDADAPDDDHEQEEDA
jgi:ribosome maturation factor RimP